MDRTISIRVRVRRYPWKEFVYDVINVTVFVLHLFDEFSKRYLKRSLKQLLKDFYGFVVKVFWTFMIGMWSYLFIAGWFGWR